MPDKKYIYKIRPKQASAYLNALRMMPVQLLMIFVPMILILLDIELTAKHYFLMIIVLLVIVLIINFIITNLLKDKINNIALMIDQDAIYINSNFVGKMFGGKSIFWHEIERIDYAENLTKDMLGSYLSKFDPYLKHYKKSLIIYANTKDNFGKISKQLFIGQNMWQIDDFDRLIDLFADKGYIVQYTDNQTYIKKYAPQLQDLGKRAGYLAYLSIVVFIIAGILLYFDDYLTLDFLNTPNIFIGVALIVAIIATYYLYQENRQLTGMVVLPIFVPVATFFLFAMMLFLSPLLGKTHWVDFDFKGGKWQGDYHQIPLSLECQKNRTKIQSDGKVMITDTLGMIRIHFDEVDKLCQNSKFSKG